MKRWGIPKEIPTSRNWATGIMKKSRWWETGIPPRFINPPPPPPPPPPRLQRMLRFYQIRLSLSIPTHLQAMWSKYGECLLPIHGEIRPLSCLPGNASAILGCPNLEIPASDDQRCNCLQRYLAREGLHIPAHGIRKKRSACDEMANDFVNHTSFSYLEIALSGLTTSHYIDSVV